MRVLRLLLATIDHGHRGNTPEGDRESLYGSFPGATELHRTSPSAHGTQPWHEPCRDRVQRSMVGTVAVPSEKFESVPGPKEGREDISCIELGRDQLASSARLASDVGPGRRREWRSCAQEKTTPVKTFRACNWKL